MERAEPLDIAGVSEALGARLPNGDKDREYHFDMVSALQKSVRGSDPDAALYWFAQMLERGEDMKFILRRLTIMASEEVGVADPQALAQRSEEHTSELQSLMRLSNAVFFLK